MEAVLTPPAESSPRPKKPGSHGSTFGGTPLACAAGVAVLDVIEKEKLLAHVSTQGARWLVELAKVGQAFPQHIAAVRGRGFLVGLQFTADPSPLLADLRERGLLVVPSGNNVLRFLPPLVATAAELDQATAILRAALAAKA